MANSEDSEMEYQNLKESIAYKEAGNTLFKETHYEKAIEKYYQAIECVGSSHKSSAVYFSNKAQCEILLERYGIAITDALAAINADSTYIKAYYRLAVAYTNLGKLKEAITALETLQKQLGLSSSTEVKEKLQSLRQLKKEKEFFASFQYGEESTVISFDDIGVEEGYKGPRLEKDSIIDSEWIEALVKYLKEQKKLHKKYVWKLLHDVKNILYAERNIVNVTISEKVLQVTVCGDVHGQFYDLLNIFARNGYPSEEKPYIFNGDFVDRGSFSVEVVLLLFSLKLKSPQSIFLNRGNHENIDMNKLYGFEGEVNHKYCSKTFSHFTQTFNALPLATLISQKVLVLHGGLFQQEGVTLEDIQKINRYSSIPSSGIMCDILWADPGDKPGRHPNMRGVSLEFGADVTKKFLEDNNLSKLNRLNSEITSSERGRF